MLTGGTLGLFTGMSFVSLVEAAFWLLRTVYKQFKERNVASAKSTALSQ